MNEKDINDKDINDIIEYYNNHMHLIKPFKATVESFLILIQN